MLKAAVDDEGCRKRHSSGKTDRSDEGWFTFQQRIPSSVAICESTYGDFRDATAEDFGAHKFEEFLVVASSKGDSGWQCLVVLLCSAGFIFFSVPLTGISISLACYVASIALSRAFNNALLT
jgi:hypothetical protein